jgi:hypothetical protein
MWVLQVLRAGCGQATFKAVVLDVAFSVLLLSWLFMGGRSL